MEQYCGLYLLLENKELISQKLLSALYLSAPAMISQDVWDGVDRLSASQQVS
jgi:hypothetical protein